MPIFSHVTDYERLMLLLLVCNGSEPVNFRNLKTKYKGPSFAEVYEAWPIQERLINIYAYTLMPNHFHLVLQQLTENGITVFMKKVMTAYSMYFNTKYSHSGVIFQGRFKSSHIDSEQYFRYIFAYVHLNPLELVQKDWKEHGVSNQEGVRTFVNKYRYSSFCDYVAEVRPERAILAYDTAPDFLRHQNDLEEVFADYAENRQL